MSDTVVRLNAALEGRYTIEGELPIPPVWRFHFFHTYRTGRTLFKRHGICRIVHVRIGALFEIYHSRQTGDNRRDACTIGARPYTIGS